MTPSCGISVVVPVFNGADLLSDTLESLRRQSLAPDEVIVVDDGSSDNSAVVAERHPLRPRVVRLDTNRGVAFARNTGLMSASSDFVAYLDQDDLWLPGRLERLNQVLREDPRPQVLVTGEQVFAAEEDRHAMAADGHDFLGWVEHWRPRAAVLDLLDELPAPSGPPVLERIPPVRLLAGSITVTTSFVLPRRLSMQVGGFAGWLQAADDWILLQTLSRHCEIHRLDDKSVLYRVHPANTSASTDWPMALTVSAAAVRFGGGVVARSDARHPVVTGRLAESDFLMHHLRALATAPGRRSVADAAAAWQLLATDRADRRATARTLARAAVRAAARRLRRRPGRTVQP